MTLKIMRKYLVRSLCKYLRQLAMRGLNSTEVGVQTPSVADFSALGSTGDIAVWALDATG